CLLALACGNRVRAEDVMKQMLGMMNEMTEVLANVKDEAGVKGAVSKLAALKDKNAALRRRGGENPKQGTPRGMSAGKQKYEPQMNTAAANLMKEAVRVAALPGGLEVTKVLRSEN